MRSRVVGSSDASRAERVDQIAARLAGGVELRR
jgi:hypothetical protein